MDTRTEQIPRENFPWGRTAGLAAMLMAVAGASAGSTGHTPDTQWESADFADYEWVEVT